MTSHNLAIVWAPNILRSKKLEVNPVAAQLAISTETAVIELLIFHADNLIFNILQPTHLLQVMHEFNIFTVPTN
jgi:hypothetical protein